MIADKTKAQPDWRKRKRSNRIVNPGFQWRYIMLISGSVFFVSTFLSIILFAVLYEQARARLVNPAASYPWENTLVMIFSSVALSAVTAGAVGVWGIFLTHRVAGPLLVLEGYLREMIAGRLPVVRALRKRDEFKGLHDTLSSAVDRLRDRYQEVFDTVSDTLAIVRRVSVNGEQLDRGTFVNVAGRLERLKARAAQMLADQPGSTTTEDFDDASGTEQQYAEATA